MSNQTVCPFCNVVAGHLATCRVRLETREQRVAYAAHIYTDQYPTDSWRRCERLGISNDEFIDGMALKEQQEQEHRSWVRQYGSPAYGGWKRSKLDGRNKPWQVVEAEAERKPATPASAPEIQTKAESR